MYLVRSHLPLDQAAAHHLWDIFTNLLLQSEPALTGTLDAVQPIEEPQSRRNCEVENDFARRDLPRLNLPSTFTQNAFRLRRLWRTRRGKVPGARLIELSDKFHGETSLLWWRRAMDEGTQSSYENATTV